MTSVIEAGNERVGRLRIARGGQRIQLCGIQLRPGTQRQGIGTAIIEELKAQAAAAGVTLALDVEKDNPDTGRLYKRPGFVRAGETEEEYRLRWNTRKLADAGSWRHGVTSNQNTSTSYAPEEGSGSP